jgi:tRNA(Ile)-lysidine synthase
MGTSRIISNVLSAAARPIGIAEFAAALSKILGVSQVGCHGQPTAIGIFKLYFMITRSCYEVALLTSILGLAVSGGVDSIALATLCSRLQRPASLKSSYEAEASDSSVLKSLQNLIFQAFVVDHGLRLGSDTEAQSVSKVLENRGDSPRAFKASRLTSI